MDLALVASAPEELFPGGGQSVSVGEHEVVETVPEGEAPPFPTPGFCVKSTSCVPSAMGPSGLAAHDPGGCRGILWPKGMVPG